MYSAIRLVELKGVQIFDIGTRLIEFKDKFGMSDLEVFDIDIKITQADENTEVHFKLPDQIKKSNIQEFRR